MSSIKFELDNTIAQLRKSYGLSQSELTNHIKISRQSLSAIENGRTIPSVKVALKLSRVFKTEVNNVFFLKQL